MNILLNNGEKMPVKQWQLNNGLQSDRVSEHLWITEVACGNELLIAEPLINIFQMIRYIWAKPLIINSGYRTQAKQEELRDAGYRAAITSPHVQGYALDIDTKSKDQTLDLVSVIRMVRDSGRNYVRIGWKQYMDDGNTFVHIDVAPYYHGKGRIWESKLWPEAWGLCIEW